MLDLMAGLKFRFHLQIPTRDSFRIFDKNSCQHVVANPGFPRRGESTPNGRAPPYYMANFNRKLHENEENLAVGPSISANVTIARHRKNQCFKNIVKCAFRVVSKVAWLGSVF